MRILVVRLSALGDVVHTLPLVAALRRAFPDAQIDWLVDERYEPLLELVPVIDRRLTLPRTGSDAWLGFLRVAAALRRRRYDIAFDAQGLLRSAVVARLGGARRVVGFDRGHLREPAARWFHTEHISASPDDQHVVDKTRSLIAALDVEPGGWEFPLEVRPSTTLDETRRALGVGEADPFVLLNPGTAWESKCWEPEKYGLLAARLRSDHGLASAVSWGPGEEARARAVVAASDSAAVMIPRTTIVDLAAYARAASVVVAGDTGPLHLAAALGTPVVGIYGPSDPTRNGPWSSSDRVVSRFLACPCGRDRVEARGVVVKRCQESRHCLDDVSVDEVADVVTQRLGLPAVHA